MKKIINVLNLLIILLLTGCSLLLTHYDKGLAFTMKGQSEKAIEEYKKGLFTNDNKMLFGLYNNIGVSYELLGNRDDAKKNYLKAVEVWPARAYYPYSGLASIAHKQGKMQEAVQYSKKAKRLVQSAEYGKIERGRSAYEIETVKKRAIARNDYYQLSLDFAELKKQFERKRFKKARLLADKIINKKYHVDLGLNITGEFVHDVDEGSIADLNGILKGDEILEINGIKMTGFASLMNSIANMSERFGENISIKVKRRNREITIKCYLYYPELETVKRIRNKAIHILAKGKTKSFSKDIEPPQLLILKPAIKRGIRFFAKKTIDFAILAGDNFQVKKLSVNGITFNSSEASILEKNLLAGQVKKYTGKVSLIAGKKTYFIKATDTSGNVTSKKITVIHNPHIEKQQDTIYRHRIAVVVGIDKYNTWPSLEFAVSDAKAVKEKLYALGFDTVIELYNREATRLQMLRLLGDKLPNLLNENDSLMIYFAGHGQTETFEYRDKQGQKIKEKEGYIIPIDADTQNYRGTAISMSKIREMSKKYKAKHILFVFDSCYSGLGLKRSGGIKKVDGYIKKLSQLKAVQILTAGGENEQVGEEKGHGIFTRHFLLALEGKADLDNDGFITASEIGTFIRPSVSRKTKNAQTPRFGWISGEGDFIFETPSK